MRRKEAGAWGTGAAAARTWLPDAHPGRKVESQSRLAHREDVAAPFTAPSSPARGFRALFGRMRPDPQAEAIAELRTLLAAADRIRDLPHDAAALAVARHEVAFASLNATRHALYREYLLYCL